MINLNQYTKFVSEVTSKESNDLEFFINNLKTLKGVNISLLLTGVCGLTSESGEAMEIVKKILFQGKPLTEENIYHLKRELGDIIWYWVNACRALNVDPYEIITMNMDKLKSRYPGGEFDAFFSENRKDGDL